MSSDEKRKKTDDIKYNPYFDFSLDLKIRDNGYEYMNDYFNLSENYILANQTNGQLIPRNTTLNLRVSDLKNIYILYNCHNITFNSCIIPEENINNEFVFYSNFHGFILDHQNENIPLYKGQDLTYSIPLFFKNPSIINYYWKIIKYKNENKFSKLINKLKGKDEEETKIFGLTGDYTDRDYFRNQFYGGEYFGNRVNDSNYRTMGFISFSIDFNHYEEYSRTQKNIWDTISNICSLTIIVFRVLSFLLTTFYSNNFDNYKIIEKIMSNPGKISEKKAKKQKITELTEDNNKKNSLLIGSINEENRTKSEEEINIIDNEDEDENNIDYDIENKSINNINNLPKFRFIDFLFNNIYSLKGCKIKKQEIISKCNEIIVKYFSIEKIIYNQLIIENLLKDYNWNNVELSKFDNNELIIQLKNLITSIKTT